MVAIGCYPGVETAQRLLSLSLFLSLSPPRSRIRHIVEWKRGKAERDVIISEQCHSRGPAASGGLAFRADTGSCAWPPGRPCRACSSRTPRLSRS